jgi:hypothetical protein
MQLRRVVQAQEAAFHAPAFCKLRQHGCDMTSSALHSTWRIQLWEQANDHGLSLPCAAMIGKLRFDRNVRLYASFVDYFLE